MSSEKPRNLFVLENRCSLHNRYYSKIESAYEDIQINDVLIRYKEVTPSDSRKDAYIAMLEEQNAEMHLFFNKTIVLNKIWIDRGHFCDSKVELQSLVDKIKNIETKCAQIRARFENNKEKK